MATITQVKDRINQLDQASFQILCDALLSREGYSNIVGLGTEDGAQKTTSGTPDTYFSTPDGKYVFAEYTTQKSGLAGKITADIQKCMDVSSTHVAHSEIAEIIYCHTSSNIPPATDAKLHRVCESAGIKLTLIGIDTLAERIMHYPSLIKDHLNLTIDTEQIQTAEDFQKQYNANSLAATLDTVFLPREKAFDAIDTAFSSVNVVLLTGPAGTGKTRLALAYAKKHSQVNGEQLLFVHDRALPLYEDATTHFEKPGAYFIVIDDANQLSGNNIGYIIEYVNKSCDGYDVKVLITVRDYALQKVKSEIGGIVRFDDISLAPFSDDEIKTLMQDNYGIKNPAYLNRIATIAEGNARIAMLAGKIACDENRLDSINDVSELYADYYGKALREAEIDSNNDLLISAGIMAFLNAIHLDYIDALQPVFESTGLSKERFKASIQQLHCHEIVDLCNDKGVRFSEQCLANFVLKYVFYDRKLISLSVMIEACFMPYRERTIQAINTLLSVFRNDDLCAFVESEIKTLWDKLENDGSIDFIEYVKAFHPVNPTKTLLILQELIESAPTVKMAVEEIDTEKGKNYQHVSNDILIILGGYADNEYLEAALDLFFQYFQKRPDLYMQFYHASAIYYCICKESFAFACKTQVQYFEKIAQYADGWRNPYIMSLYFEVAEQFLHLSFSKCENTRNDKSVVFYTLALPQTDGVRKYRELIWNQLIELTSRGNYSKQIINILRNYGHSCADYNKDVVCFDTKYIGQLVKTLLSGESLADCLVAISLKKFFEIAEYPAEELDELLCSQKVEIYQILTGSEWDGRISFEELEAQRKQGVLRYLDSCDNKADAFHKLLAVYTEYVTCSNRDSYKLNDSINTAIRDLAKSKDLFIKTAQEILAIDYLGGIDIAFITRTLFDLFQPEIVLDMLSHSNEHNNNCWLYTYYHELPEECVNKKELAGLSSFLADDSDRAITYSSYRDIDFLAKYQCADADAFLNGVSLIFEKRTYSPLMVEIYLLFQFNEYSIQPRELIEKFERNIPLLEKIYLFFESTQQGFDYNGKFLHEICLSDKGFLSKYLSLVFDNSPDGQLKDDWQKFTVFYQDTSFVDTFDSIVNEAINKLDFPTMTVPHIVKGVLALPKNDEENELKRSKWIEHYIEKNSTDDVKMQCLFMALSELSMTWLQKYLPLFCHKNKDFEVFRKLALFPTSYSWEGSAVPLYSSWISQLEQLLPIFSGLDFLKHRIYVEDVIQNLRQRIADEEISDIIRG